VIGNLLHRPRGCQCRFLKACVHALDLIHAPRKNVDLLSEATHLLRDQLEVVQPEKVIPTTALRQSPARERAVPLAA
jgi:hypothetical protein